MRVLFGSSREDGGHLVKVRFKLRDRVSASFGKALGEVAGESVCGREGLEIRFGANLKEEK
jgi:hypothetical protein